MLCSSDVGGTFTDLIFLEEGRISAVKIPSTPRDPASAVREGVAGKMIDSHAHGTTIATNAILEGRGARTALITTKGFEDLLVIGRQRRPSLYDLRVANPPAPVPRDLSYGLRERVGPKGEVLAAPEPQEVKSLAEIVRVSGAEAVAISFLFSFLRPEHEELMASALGAEICISTSHEVLPEAREYERTSTTVLDAFIKPLVRSYLKGLVGELARRLYIMQSNGGVQGAAGIVQRPIDMVLSGPAGGAAGVASLAGLLDEPNLLGLDMGGTSTDVSVVLDGEPTWTTEGRVGAFPVALPMLAIDSIGAGGGSIAWVDRGGALRVGPKSAGADPGPMAYGRGGMELTVTDADLLSGLLGEYLLGGKMRLQRTLAEEGLRRLAKVLGMGGDGALMGIRRVVRSNMQRAVGVALARGGFDPRDFTLVAFGGAGPMHGASLAAELGIRRVIVPFLPGLFSAYGILVSDLRFHYGRSLLVPLATSKEAISGILGELKVLALRDLEAHGLDGSSAKFLPSVDMRYRGQGYEVNVPLGADDLGAMFSAAHLRRYGTSNPGEPIEVVTIRLNVVVRRPKPLPPPPSGACPPPLLRKALFLGGWREVEVHSREALAPGFTLRGPAIIEEESATTVVPSEWTLEVDALGLLHLERR